jgi:glycerol-3-phosphate acyltransferase PlsX
MAGLLLKPAFRRLRRRLDYSEVGGAPLLGVDGTCIIAHGRSNVRAIKNAIRVAARCAEAGVAESIRAELQRIAPEAA